LTGIDTDGIIAIAIGVPALLATFWQAWRQEQNYKMALINSQNSNIGETLRDNSST
jgi:hypothetical protein